jgi:hypothetical protein
VWSGRGEVMGGGGRNFTMSVNIFYYLPNNIKCHNTYEGEVGGECSTPWKMRYSYLILAGIPQLKRSLGRSKC